VTAGGARIERSLRRRRPALAAFVTGGCPVSTLQAVARAADVVEIGVPFSDPVADGPTIQRASRDAIRRGVTLRSILEELRGLPLEAPVVLMSYANPLLAYGVERLAADAAASGVSGFLVPDLPLEEQELLAPALSAASIALVQLVAPTTPPDRARHLAAASAGFVYAVAVTGTTGGEAIDLASLRTSIAALREACALPILAGFGIREPGHVAAIVPPADGVVVGSALLEAIERGDDPERFLTGLVR